ncbi:MAG: superinfection exclusion B family protein [Bacilli bacterium]|nr:superinfection exclusion B family protein [Bacilli bacterium]
MKDLPTSKKVLYGTLLGADVALTIFFLVVSIVMIATMPDKIDAFNGNYQDNFIGYFQQNPTVFLFVVVIPLILLFIANIFLLVWYAKKTNEKKKVELSDLSDEEKAKLREALMKDLQGGNKE